MAVVILSKSVAERIAAGEVVERPASVVKELVENSIDAGATAIAIEIREGGTASIRVSDNGCGMTREDAATAVERFATSKIRSVSDLDTVRTLGFRGEALPSIASISQLEILTRVREEMEGTRVRLGDGQKEIGVAGAPVGTQVIVRRLFYNAPARRKFLKAPLRETELIHKTVMVYALAYPHIAFRLVVDGRESLVAPAANPLERIGAVWGREVAGEMLEVDYVNVDQRIRGFVSRPALVRASREWQLFYVNGRPVRSGLLAVTLERPFAGRVPPNRHPLALLHIEIDPKSVDVNVHPRKAEVRFYQERAIYGSVQQAVEAVLRDFPSGGAFIQSDWPFAQIVEGEPRSSAMVSEDPAEYRVPWRALAQVHNTYILAQTGDGMVIVDQHAAQEQIFYELLTTTAGGPRAALNQSIPLTARERGLVTASLEEYHALGIDLELFGEGMLRLNAVPSFVRVEPRSLVTELFQEHERNRNLRGDALRDKLAAKAACISAIKAGDALDLARQQALLDDLARAFAPATCPHGRPVFIALPLQELERRFLRR